MGSKETYVVCHFEEQCDSICSWVDLVWFCTETWGGVKSPLPLFAYEVCDPDYKILMHPTYWKFEKMAEFYRTVAKFYLFLHFKFLESLAVSYSEIFVGWLNDNIYVCILNLTLGIAVINTRVLHQNTSFTFINLAFLNQVTVFNIVFDYCKKMLFNCIRFKSVPIQNK